VETSKESLNEHFLQYKNQIIYIIGFSSDKSRRWMMKPTEVSKFDWDR